MLRTSACASPSGLRMNPIFAALALIAALLVAAAIYYRRARSALGAWRPARVASYTMIACGLAWIAVFFAQPPHAGNGSQQPVRFTETHARPVTASTKGNPTTPTPYLTPTVLAVPEAFELIIQSPFRFPRTFPSPCQVTAYSALLGSRLPPADALEAYSQLLSADRWEVTDSWTATRHFQRDNHFQSSLSNEEDFVRDTLNRATPEFRQAYQRAETQYPSLTILIIGQYLPDLATCDILSPANSTPSSGSSSSTSTRRRSMSGSTAALTMTGASARASEHSSCVSTRHKRTYPAAASSSTPPGPWSAS